MDILLSLPCVSAEPPDHDDTPLYLAAKGLHCVIMQALLEKGADPNKRSYNSLGCGRWISPRNFVDLDAYGPTPLHAVCMAGRRGTSSKSGSEAKQKSFQLLVEAGSDINSVTTFGETALHQSVQSGINGNIEVSLPKLLLDHGADVTVLNDAGETPFHFVSLSGDSAALVDLLITRGASLDVRRPRDGRTPLHSMLDTIHTLDVKPLVPHVKNWNVRDARGNTPLHLFLAKSFHPQSGFRLLVSAGADLNCKNKAGDAPIHSLQSGIATIESPVLSDLLASGASLETTDIQGRTFLLRLLEKSNNQPAGISRLLELGSKVNIADNNGDGALHYVCKSSRNLGIVSSSLSRSMYNVHWSLMNLSDQNFDCCWSRCDVYKPYRKHSSSPCRG